jgi:hypothetical protein
MSQVLKAQLKDFVKSTKGNKKDIFAVRFNSGNYWIYNGFLLTTKCFNLNSAIINHTVNFSNVSKDEVYIIEQITDQHKQIFGLS